MLAVVPSSRVLGNILGHTDLLHQLSERGYDVLHVTSKFGAYVNKTKVSREVFSLDNGAKKKDASLCSSITACPKVSTCLVSPLHPLRNLNVVEMAQTIGRVIRLDGDDAARLQSGELQPQQWGFYNKPTGFVTVPVHRNYGAVIKRLQRITDEIFVKECLPLPSCDNRTTTQITPDPSQDAP